ncbi:MAG: hypothetical protein U9P12_00445, partial [Verrucomicrobiota bacterium]|nr:hypothetical protein [Verrucomicrobiota bacterium]
FIHSGDAVWCPVELPDTPKRIIGYGNSSFVKTEGRGLYFIDITADEVQIEIYPHARFVRNWWEWHTDGKPVVELDDQTAFPFELNLPGRESIKLNIKPGTHTVRAGLVPAI